VCLSSTLAFRFVRAITRSRASSLHERYFASPLLQAQPPRSRLLPTSRCPRLYGFPAPPISRRGRGGLLQLLSMSLSSCCRHHPARVARRVGQYATVHAAFVPRLRTRPLGLALSRPPLRLLRYGPMTRNHPMDDFVDRLQRFSFYPLCYPSYEAFDSYLGRTSYNLPLNTPAFTGRTTQRADFPHWGD